MSIFHSVTKNGRYAWYVAILLSMAHLVSFLDRFVMGVVLVPVKNEFALSDTQLGLLHGTGFVILYTLLALPLGRMADISNRRNLIIAGIVLWSLATAASGLSTSFSSLFLARVGVGFGEAALVPAAMSLLAAYFGRKQLGRAVGTFTMGASLGLVAAFIGGGALLGVLTVAGGMDVPGIGHLSPWKALFLLTSIPGFFLAVLLLTVREPKRVKDETVAKPSIRGAFQYIGQRKHAYFWHVAASVSAIIIIQSFSAWTPTLYVRSFGFTPAEAGMAVGLVILISAPLGHFAGGYLVDEFHRRGIESAPGLVIALMLALAVVPTVAFCLTSNVTLSLVLFGISKFFLTAAAPAGLAGIQMITPDRLRGLVTACFLATVTFLAIGLGPFLVGLITDRVFGDEKSLPYSLLAMTLFFVVFGGMAALKSRPAFQKATLDS